MEGSSAVREWARRRDRGVRDDSPLTPRFLPSAPQVPHTSAPVRFRRMRDERLRLIHYTSGVIVARSARPCGVLLPHLLLAGSQNRLDEVVAVPDLQGRALDVDVDPASTPVLATTDLLAGH